MPSCAACLRPIHPGEKFTLASTEVFHRECAPNIAQSIGTRQKLEIIRLRSQLATEEQETARLRVAISDTHQAGERKLAEIKGGQVMQNLKASTAKKLRDEAEAALRSVRYDLDLITRQRDAARADATAARSELALMQTLAGSRTSAPSPETTAVHVVPDPPKDERDDSEQQFALLELDLLK